MVSQHPLASGREQPHPTSSQESPVLIFQKEERQEDGASPHAWAGKEPSGLQLKLYQPVLPATFLEKICYTKP